MSKFKVGQVVKFPSTGNVGIRARKGGTVTKVEQMFELKEENKRFNPSGTCRGELTTIKELSNGKTKGFAYITKTIQPKGFRAETITVEGEVLELSTEKMVLDSYTLSV